MTNEPVTKRARDLLLHLYEAMKVDGVGPSRDEFFPVDLERIITDVLLWEPLHKVTELGWQADQRERAFTDYDKKTITVALPDLAAPPPDYPFTVAHEIGHVVLHPEGPPQYRLTPQRSTPRDERRTEKWRRERDADTFAAALLMPPKAVREYFKELVGDSSLWTGSARARDILSTDGSGGDQEATARTLATRVATVEFHEERPTLAEYFGVSALAMGLQLLSLGLVY